MAEAVTQAEFARRLGKDKSYVTRLKQAGRLVLDPSGKVDVDASLRRIEETKDPNRDDVAARHAACRADTGADRADDGDVLIEPDVSLPQAIAALERAREAWYKNGGAVPLLPFQSARQLKANVEALTAGLEALAAAGRLVPTDNVRRVIADRLTTLRTHLEAIPGALAPSLAAITDETEIRLLLSEHIEQLLTDLSEGFAEHATRSAP